MQTQDTEEEPGTTKSGKQTNMTMSNTIRVVRMHSIKAMDHNNNNLPWF